MVFVVGLQSDITAAREMEAALQKLVGMTNRLSKINALTSFGQKWSLEDWKSSTRSSVVE